MRSIRTVPAAIAAEFESLASFPRRHRAVARVSLAALAFTVVTTLSLQDATRAGPDRTPKAPAAAILPQNVGVGVETDQSVVLAFDQAMDPTSVEAGLQLHPAQGYQLAWSDDMRSAELRADRRWRTDERYVVVVHGNAQHADGSPAGRPQRFSFTTETAPVVNDFQVRLAGRDLPREAVSGGTLAAELESVDAPAGADAAAELAPTRTAEDVSASSAITISFSAPMAHSDVEERFAISPTVDGELSWDGGSLVFSPTERLEPGMRYTISLAGTHDEEGNVLGGKSNFSFVVRPGAQLVRVQPGLGETNVQTETVEMWFSQPMDTEATVEGFAVVDLQTSTVVPGTVSWNEAGNQLTFRPQEPFQPGRSFDVRLEEGSRDADGNPVERTWSFATVAAAVPARSSVSTRVAPAPAIPPPAPSSDMAVYALNQINAARGAYGFAPVTLDASITAVAYAHAYDQAVNGYFSHTSLDGRTREDRLRAGGVSYSWSGENQCYLVGRSLQATLDWCHAQFMSEPYPGQFNHIANILNPNARRVGVGIAQSGSRVIITWNFTN